MSNDNTKQYVDKTYLNNFWNERVKEMPQRVPYGTSETTSAEFWAENQMDKKFYSLQHNTIVGAINELGCITDMDGLTVTKAVGGIAKGKEYPVGTPLVNIITDLLAQYYAPQLTVTVSPNPNELGVATTGSATVKLTAGSKAVSSCSYSYKYMDGEEEKTKEGSLTFSNGSATLSGIPVSGVASQTYSDLFAINDGTTTVKASATFKSEAKVIAFFSSSATMTAEELASKISAADGVYRDFEAKAVSSAAAKTKYAINVPMTAGATGVYLYVACPTASLVKIGDSMDTSKSMQPKATLSNVACNSAVSNYNVYRAADTSNDDGSHKGTFYFWKDV